MRAKFSSIHWLTPQKFPSMTHTSGIPDISKHLAASIFRVQAVKESLLNYQLVQEDFSEVSNYLQFAMAS
jgi:hypothetical protein